MTRERCSAALISSPASLVMRTVGMMSCARRGASSGRFSGTAIVSKSSPGMLFVTCVCVCVCGVLFVCSVLIFGGEKRVTVKLKK